MGVYIHYYPSSDEYPRIGSSLWPELLRCLREVNEKDFKLLLNLPENGIIDEDQISELAEAFEKNKEMIYDWFYSLPEDYPFDETLDAALWGFANNLIDMDRNSPGIIQFDIPDHFIATKTEDSE